MAAKEYQVNCIRQTGTPLTHEHISHIGNTVNQWLMAKETAIKRIDSGTEAYFVVDPRTSAKAFIGVVREPGKAPFLRTHADGTYNNNLLAQGHCDGSCKLIS